MIGLQDGQPALQQLGKAASKVAQHGVASLTCQSLYSLASCASCSMPSREGLCCTLDLPFSKTVPFCPSSKSGGISKLLRWCSNILVFPEPACMISLLPVPGATALGTLAA